MKKDYVISVPSPLGNCWLTEPSDEDDDDYLATTSDPDLAARYGTLAEAEDVLRAVVKQHALMSFRIDEVGPGPERLWRNVLTMDNHYNKQNFPHFVCHHGNWDIYANDRGYCASIPTDEAAGNGCRATHFGDAGYVKATLGVTVSVTPNTDNGTSRLEHQRRDMRRPLTALDELSLDHRIAICDFREANGRNWKSKLNAGWLQAKWPGPLQQIRNAFGPEWLERVKESDFGPTVRIIRCEEANLGVLRGLGAECGVFDHAKGVVEVKVTPKVEAKLSEFSADFQIVEEPQGTGFGAWAGKGIDGLAYQESMRSEWEP